MVQAAWTALTNGYLYGFVSGKIYTGKTKKLCVPGLNCYSCPGALGSCPLGALQSSLNSPVSKFAFLSLGFLIFFGSLFGRFVCGWLCPFGLVQDLLHKIPVFSKRKNIPGHRCLKYLKYVVLAVLVAGLPTLVKNSFGMKEPWFCEYLCPSGTLLGGIPLVILNPELQSLIGIRFWWKVAVLTVIIVASVKYYRPFCKYLCPLGAFYGCFNPVAFYRYELDSAKCTGCGACTKACGMGIDPSKTPNSAECIRCGDCVRVCPEEAIKRVSYRKKRGT